MAEQPDAITLLREELAQARAEISSLQVKTVTTLSGVDLITILMLGPLVFAFVALGIVIVWKTTSNPAAVAPHLDIILVAYAVFSNPVSAAMGAVMTRYNDQQRNGSKKDAS